MIMSETTESVPQTETEQQPTVTAAVNAFLDKWEDSPAETSEPVSESEAEVADTSDEQLEATQDQEAIEEVVDLGEEELVYEDEVVDSEEVQYETAPDDYVTQIKVGEDIHEVSVADLKRLYGQEKSLTQKSQQVSEQRKSLDTEVERTQAAYGVLLQKAQEKLQPYTDIDMLVASKQMNDDEFAQLRKEAQSAYDEYNFLAQEAGKFHENLKQAREKEIAKQAAEAHKTLKADIPEWNEDLYNAVRDWGATQGLDRDALNNLVDPAAIKVLLKAMKYDRSKKVAVKKRGAAPRKVIKPGASAPAQTKQARAGRQAMEKLTKTGSTQDATNAFLQRWSDGA